MVTWITVTLEEKMEVWEQNNRAKFIETDLYLSALLTNFQAHRLVLLKKKNLHRLTTMSHLRTHSGLKSFLKCFKVLRTRCFSSALLSLRLKTSWEELGRRRKTAGSSTSTRGRSSFHRSVEQAAQGIREPASLETFQSHLDMLAGGWDWMMCRGPFQPYQLWDSTAGSTAKPAPAHRAALDV